MAVASLVLGICSILFVFTPPIVSIMGIMTGAVGIVLSVQARRQEPSDMATGGLVTSIIGCSLSLVINLACAACIYGGIKAVDWSGTNQQIPKISKSLEDFTKSLKELEKEANKKAETKNK
jgi:hypothetical protein